MNFAEPVAMTLGAVVALGWAYGCLSFVAHLKRKARLRTGYTRKLFHLLIFTSAGLVPRFGGLRVWNDGLAGGRVRRFPWTG